MFTYTVQVSELNKIANGLSDAQTEAIEKITFAIDYDSDYLLINDNKYKVVDDWDYIYKIQKTQIRARGGAQGLYNEFLKTNNDDLWNGLYTNILQNIINKVKPVTK